ncbi:MAG: protein-disulfide isomerase [Nitrosomonadaceae bacterium]|nr:protein-disulfide isomerase [Nitrosomonadaceae bacterium]|tara:strand:+ start:135 stop:758 length:624 start_codon:yes stop_codon:yes gene_type:complete
MSKKILWYIADPMCSWCWGFSPIIEAIRVNYNKDLKIKLIMGGLRSGKSAMEPKQRAEILGHWKSVNNRTGQPFSFAGAMPEGFIYDTEPSCRGVVAMALINPDLVFPFLKSIHFAFYVEQENVTDPNVLAYLAGKIGIGTESYLKVFESDEAKDKVLTHFKQVRQWGVHSFPTLLSQDMEVGYSILNSGYITLDAVYQKIDGWLNT